MGFTETLMEHITHLIEITGYWGVGFLMALESMIAPVPSEAVMPFAGFLICDGKMTFLGVAVSSTIGSLIGSLLSYTMGYFGGKPFVHWFGRFLFLNVHHLEMTEHFFSRHGGKTVFISRFIPIVRHLISIPAGVGRMHLFPFAVYTIVGACLWNTFLAWCGHRLRDHWEIVHLYSGKIDIAVVAIFGIVGLYFAAKHFSVFRRRRAANGSGAPV
jgi:membrane protein DedA with SNARE-associated domain